jgi:tRNA pseudouridine38-40 synthase
MTRNFKLIIEYDGSRYHGWQRQKEDRSIQGEIEKALKTITAGSVTLNGSGRTDAGVHAQGQVANFECNTRLEPDALMNGLNSLLQDDIVIKVCEPVSASFHARYDAKSKVYHYRILNRPLPAAIGRQYSWFIRKALNLLVFHIEADGFLRYMVRNMVGTLVDVGLEKSTPHDFKRILHSKDRSQASATAPAQGLMLMEVKY